MQLSTPMPTNTPETVPRILTPDTSGGTEARRLTPDAVATAPAARGGEGSGRPLGGSCGRRCARGTGADGSNRGSRLAGLRSRGEIARGGSAGWAGGAGSALGSNRVVKDPVRGSRGLGAGCALGARGRLGGRAVGVASRAWGTGITSRRGAADAVKGQGRVSADARWSARARGARADVTSLVNISGLFSERSLAIQGAALAGDQVPSLLLRHMLVAREGQLGKDGSLVLLLSVQVSKLSLPLSCHPSLRLHDLLCLVGASRGLVTLVGVEVLEVGSLGASGVIKVVNRMRARARGVVGGARVSATHSIALARLLQVFISSVDLVELIREGVVVLGLRSTGACTNGSSRALVLPVALGRSRPLRVVVVGHVVEFRIRVGKTGTVSVRRFLKSRNERVLCGRIFRRRVVQLRSREESAGVNGHGPRESGINHERVRGGGKGTKLGRKSW